MALTNKSINVKINQMRYFLMKNKDKSFKWQLDSIKYNFWNNFDTCTKFGIYNYLKSKKEKNSNFKMPIGFIDFLLPLFISVVALIKSSFPNDSTKDVNGLIISVVVLVGVNAALRCLSLFGDRTYESDRYLLVVLQTIMDVEDKLIVA